MTISFNLIPSNIRTPGTYIEIDNSKALRGLPQFLTRILVIGQKLSTGTKNAEELTLVSSVEQAKSYFGTGSMLANMFKALKANNKYIETWAIALDDADAGVAAAGSIDFTDSDPTENGTLSLYIAGERVQVAILSTHTDDNIATNVAAAINAAKDLPVTAAVDGETTSKVNITARHKGEVGNTLDIRLNYLGDPGGERTPAGVTATITQMANGATNPDVADAIAVLPDEIYDFILIPYDDATNLTAMETELDSRWGPLKMLEGHCFIAKEASQANLTTFGNGRNNPHVTCLGYNNSPTPPYEWAAAMVAQVALSATIDPARPFTTLELVGVKAPPEASRFTQEERNTLLYDGIATYTVTRAGKVQLERVITMYQLSDGQTVDPSYLDYTTLATLAYIRQDLRGYLSTMFRQFKIASDGTRISAGQRMTTPSRIKAAVVARFKQWLAAGLVEDLAQFKEEIIVERNEGDPTRVDIQMPPNLVNPLHVIAGQIQYLL